MFLVIPETSTSVNISDSFLVVKQVKEDRNPNKYV